MSEASKPARPDLESARDSIRVKGPPPETSIGLESQQPDGTRWDKEAPTGPPNAKDIEIPSHLGEVAAFFQEIILSESFLLELCFDRAYKIVEDAINRRIFGSDSFVGDGEGSMGGPFTPTHYATIAGPMTIELYKNVLLSVAAQEKDYKEILERAQKKAEDLRQEKLRARQKNPIGKGGIITDLS